MYFALARLREDALRATAYDGYPPLTEAQLAAIGKHEPSARGEFSARYRDECPRVGTETVTPRSISVIPCDCPSTPSGSPHRGKSRLVGSDSLTLQHGRFAGATPPPRQNVRSHARVRLYEASTSRWLSPAGTMSPDA